ncbi:uncharacterized protein [Haliotis cracherodii]|uniref:uncharacterized protein n=1 Tax=Haliotis cracherodii TaxID=6455 RepID=UPI0039E935FE
MTSRLGSMAEDEGCDNIYGFGCRSSTTSATNALLSVAAKNSQGLIGDGPRLQRFLEAYDRVRCDPSEKGQKKVKASLSGQRLGGSQGDGNTAYVFSHFDDIDKYMQRYRYYHTVCDAGHTGMDPHLLGIEVASMASDDTSNKSLMLNDLTEHGPSISEFRTLLFGNRRSRTDPASARRNKSAPCSQNPRQSKRLYLTWEEYMSTHDPDVTPRQSPLHLGSCRSFVVEKDEQTTPKTVRKVSSAFPLRSSSASLTAGTTRTRVKLKDSSNAKGKENLDVVKSPIIVTHTPLEMNSRRVSFSVSVTPRASSSSTTTSTRFKMATVKGRSSACNKAVMQEIVNNKTNHHFAEASRRSPPQCQRSHNDIVSSPHTHPEQCKTDKCSGKVPPPSEQFKKLSNSRCRHSRVGVMYKFTKVRRHQIHL